MGDMYSKLGDLLNDALEKGEIPQKKSDESKDFEGIIRNNESENFKKDEKEDKTQKTRKRIHIFTQKSQKQTAEVIKMHKYTENMYISPEILHALDTLDIAYPTDLKMIKKQYHKLLKELHPDTKTTIQSSNNVENSRQNQKSIDEIQAAYNYLKTLYKK